MTGLPLAGQRVVVTRAAHQAGELRGVFETAGAEVALLPLLEVVPPADGTPLENAAAGLAAFDWLAFTSVNAVRAFLPRVANRSLLPSVAAVGPATAETLRSLGVEPWVVAREARAIGLAKSLAPWLSAGDRIMIPQAEDARPDLAEGLAAAGAEVTTVVAYRKRLPAGAVAVIRQLFSTAPLGWVTFTSPRIVRHFVELLGATWDNRRRELKAASIGPVTSDELRRLGVEPAAEADRPVAEELVLAVVRAVG